MSVDYKFDFSLDFLANVRIGHTIHSIDKMKYTEEEEEELEDVDVDNPSRIIICQNITEGYQNAEKNQIHHGIKSLNQYLITHKNKEFPELVSYNIIEILLDFINLFPTESSTALNDLVLITYNYNLSELILNIPTLPNLYNIFLSKISKSTLYSLIILLNLAIDEPNFIPILYNNINPKDAYGLFNIDGIDGFKKLKVISVQKRIVLVITRIFFYYTKIPIKREDAEFIFFHFQLVIETLTEGSHIALHGIMNIINRKQLWYDTKISINLIDYIEIAIMNVKMPEEDAAMCFRIAGGLIDLGYKDLNISIQQIAEQCIDLFDTEIGHAIYELLASIMMNSDGEAIQSYTHFDLLDIFINGIMNGNFIDFECSYKIINKMILGCPADEIDYFLKPGLFEALLRLLQSGEIKVIDDTLEMLKLTKSKSNMSKVINLFDELFLNEDLLSEIIGIMECQYEESGYNIQEKCDYLLQYAEKIKDSYI